MIAEGIQLLWMAPFFAGGGYSSEAFDFLAGVLNFGKSIKEIKGCQFAEHVNKSFMDQVLAGSPHIRDIHEHGHIQIMQDQMDMCRLPGGKQNPNPMQVVVCHSMPDVWHADGLFGWGQHNPCPPMPAINRKEVLTVGRTMWESDDIPADWVEKLTQMDYIFVPTQFQAKIFRKYMRPNKVHVLPEPIETEFWRPLLPKEIVVNRTLGPVQAILSQGALYFLAVGKWELRKGFHHLIKAFKMEFKEYERNVALVIKTTMFHADPEELEEWRGKDPRIVITHQQLPDIDLRVLYQKAAAVVQPSYAEGWGRAHTEAMAMEKVLIAPKFSGPEEFLNEDNALLVDYKLVPHATGVGKWAEVNIDSLREKMRWAYDHYGTQEAIKIGSAARQTIVRYGTERVTRKLESLLKHCIEEKALKKGKGFGTSATLEL